MNKRIAVLMLIAASCSPVAAEAEDSQLGAQIVLVHSDLFEVGRIWSGADELAVPGNLGGMLFSPDGSSLYVVGDSETTRSAVYEVPVVRDPETGEVIDLLPSSGAVFEGHPAAIGLDAGLEIGPEGTIFSTYLPANQIGERPGGLSGTETLFAMSPVGIPRSIAGLTFSPHRIDSQTQFGRMLVSSWADGALYEVPLAPLGGGLFQPAQSVRFVTLPFAGTGGIQFISAGFLRGNLMYVDFNNGTIRILTISRFSGLPIDGRTGRPTLGTTNPVDALFASGFGEGPWGLEFDPITGDLFVSTWLGDPPNSVIRITGPGIHCGDGVLQSNEPCDGSNLAGETCPSRGAGIGTLACSSTCDAFDTSGCVPGVKIPGEGTPTADE